MDEFLTPDRLQEAFNYAHTKGLEDGKAAGTWVFDGNSTIEDYKFILKGLDDGDPIVYDQLPTPDLSGEWSGNLTGPELVKDAFGELVWKYDTANFLNWRDYPTEDHPEYEDYYEKYFTDICDTYDAGFGTAMEDEVRRQIKYQLEDAE